MKKQVYLPLLLLLAASPLAAQDARGNRVEFTPFASYVFEGNFDQGFDDIDYFEDDLTVDEGAGYGLIVGFPVSRHFAVELSYSRQDTEIFNDGGIFGNPREVVLPLDIEYLHIGAAFDFGSGQVQPFVVGSVGVTRFSANGDYDSASRFSAAFGGGAKIYFSKNIGLRLQGRVITTLVDDDEEAFCNRHDCYYYDADTYLYQAEVAAGLIFAF